MKIDPTGPVRTNPVRRQKASKKEAAGSRFAVHLSDKPQAAAVTSAGPVAIDPLLAAQEIADAASESARGRVLGEAMIERLEELQQGLLHGFVPKEQLHELARLVRTQRDKIHDKRLLEILDEIDLRSQVELAKLSIDV